MNGCHYEEPWTDYRGRRTLRYWKWRFCEQFGLPWPEGHDDPDWYHSIARSYTQFRNSERGTQIYFIAEAGSMSPQLLVQVTPLCWGIGVSAGDGYLAWRVGPVAFKLQYHPMFWKKNLKKGIDLPDS